ncbi:helix-turn-helix domain-containing protein [Weissella tructae]|uniref:Uncharacterized protein n=2 Tax=Weissella TaxID=46255 RepID=A0A075TXN6_9LACO|nr:MULTISPECIES: hypothetical protein [Weissella]AIG65096.1 hypothetical protein WS08_0157 [Weissella tructae]AIM62409.1 hypothetical protein WS74_0157 [Weissella ceti]AIM63746.1 hypothetical protein WS105_0156 [Weissella ceti]ELA07923.1 hypothetical protein WCNC_00475 [Weissella ceti NC36]QVV91488.1 DNA-binding protein [Weissella tructae]
MPTKIINLHPAMVAKLAGKTVPTIRSWGQQVLLHSTIINGSKIFDLEELVPLIRPRNSHSGNSYLIADIPDYNNFISQIAKDVAQELVSNGTLTTVSRRVQD